MRLIDFSFDNGADNLALEEAILNAVERGDSPDTLRFWENPAPCVVLGVGQKINDEVNVANCEADGIPIFRRCSAGGCVLQGPGSLNYALFMTYENYPEVRELRPSYCYILRAIAKALQARGIKASIEGTSDLAANQLKFSGNAQKRKKHAILHHGTLLYDLDANRLTRYLREPEQRPEYRGPRRHADFVRPLPLASAALRGAVLEAFAVDGSASENPSPPELQETLALSREKYQSLEWTRRR